MKACASTIALSSFVGLATADCNTCLENVGDLGDLTGGVDPSAMLGGLSSFCDAMDTAACSACPEIFASEGDGPGLRDFCDDPCFPCISEELANIGELIGSLEQSIPEEEEGEYEPSEESLEGFIGMIVGILPTVCKFQECGQQNTCGDGINSLLGGLEEGIEDTDALCDNIGCIECLGENFANAPDDDAGLDQACPFYLDMAQCFSAKSCDLERFEDFETIFPDDDDERRRLLAPFNILAPAKERRFLAHVEGSFANIRRVLNETTVDDLENMTISELASTCQEEGYTFGPTASPTLGDDSPAARTILSAALLAAPLLAFFQF